jgi:valyl-tRNA synthetase
MSNKSHKEPLKQYDHKKLEPRWINTWLQKDLFKVQINEGAGKFSIALPPPNVTGELHMGHALGGTIQDILIRYNRMLGKDVHWQIGTDHAGIGTQLVVEKQLKKTEGKSRHDYSREEFIAKVQAWKEEYGNKIIEQMKLLGFSPDYSRVRYTMDEHYAKAVQAAFDKYYKDGLIYRGKRIVNWCPQCLTSLSDLEIDKEQVKKKLYEIKYFLNAEFEYRDETKDENGALQQICETRNYLIVATTRPETMFGDTAVAINPSDTRYLELIKQVKNTQGSVQATIPFTEKNIPVILDEHVKTDFGTGALKVTPAHDANDYEIALRHDLPRVVIMNEKAILLASNDVPKQFQGLDRYKARNLIVAELERDNPLVISEYLQDKDLHDRCTTEIEPYLSDQWYVKMKPLAELALKAVFKDHRTQFIPERYAQAYKNWLENIQDWCISRQILWGHKVPIEAEQDVLDTWFSSALWPFVTMQSADGIHETEADKKIYEAFYPTTVLATAREIINLWVTRMIFSSEYFLGKEPFKDVLIHPVVQTPDGKRMSKSKGNAIDPLEMVELYGADASRMWYASVGVLGQQDVRFPGMQDKQTKKWSSDTLEQYRKFANKLFNAAKFVMMNLGDSFVPQSFDKILKQDLTVADYWILNKLHILLAEIKEDFVNYDLGAVQSKIYDFIWFNFCDWYIELSKLDLQAGSEAVKQVLFHVLEISLRLLHPIMPFITEEIWQILRSNYDYSNIDTEIINTKLDEESQKSICFALYPQSKQKLLSKANTEALDFSVNIIGAMRNLRQSLGIQWSSPIHIIFESSNEFEINSIKSCTKYIESMTKASELSFDKSHGLKPFSISIIGDTKIYVPLAGLIDVVKVKSNTEAKISKIDKDIGVLESRLKSASFIEKAAPEKVAETQEAYEDLLKQKHLYLEEIQALTHS